MKGRIVIRGLDIEVHVESESPEVEHGVQMILETARERIEAIIAVAVCEEVKRLLPGINAEFVAGDDEEDWR